MASVKLYGYATSPFVRKTGCFLYYKGIDFTHVPVDPLAPEQTIGFTGGTQVPVLEIDGEWKLESSEHAHWLDRLYPDKPLCPAEHADRIAHIDDWVSNTFLLNIFRPAVEGKPSLDFRFRAWRLAALVSAHTPLPAEVRHQWPDLVSQAPFIQAMAQRMNLDEPIADMQLRIGLELAEHIGEGPFMGGFEQPTMLDLAVFPQLVFGFMFGLEKQLSAAAHPTIKAWLRRVAEHLPANPTLIADWMQINALDDALA